MKLVRYGDAGKEKPGILDSAGAVRDLSGVVSDIDGAALSAEGLAKIRAADLNSLPKVSGSPRLGAPVGSIGKLVAIGLNYSDHAKEANQPIPSEPIIFMKATSSICGANDTVVLPRGSKESDWEVELAFAIGKTAKYVPEADALSYVAGYLICNDVSEREWQIKRGAHLGQGQGLRHLRAARTVAGDPRRDRRPAEPRHVARGQRQAHAERQYQHDDLQRRRLLSYISQCMTLKPGDVVTTGTPPGVGLGIKPNPVFLKHGDVMRLGIDGLGEQRQEVRGS